MKWVTTTVSSSGSASVPATRCRHFLQRLIQPGHELPLTCRSHTLVLTGRGRVTRSLRPADPLPRSRPRPVRAAQPFPRWRNGLTIIASGPSGFSVLAASRLGARRRRQGPGRGRHPNRLRPARGERGTGRRAIRLASGGHGWPLAGTTDMHPGRWRGPLRGAAGNERQDGASESCEQRVVEGWAVAVGARRTYHRFRRQRRRLLSGMHKKNERPHLVGWAFMADRFAADTESRRWQS